MISIITEALNYIKSEDKQIQIWLLQHSSKEIFELVLLYFYE
jgi:hypothetical protein